jgi:hypothetical protein
MSPPQLCVVTRAVRGNRNDGTLIVPLNRHLSSGFARTLSFFGGLQREWEVNVVYGKFC